MKMRIPIIALVVFTLVISSCSKESISPVDVIEIQNNVELEQQVLQSVNKHRTSLGKSILKFNATAYRYANEHTDYMVATGNINHDNFTNRASKIAASTSAEFVAENVAKDYATAAQAVEGWLSSTDHKKTIEGDFTHSAVSVKENTTGQFYYTQIFYREVE